MCTLRNEPCNTSAVLQAVADIYNGPADPTNTTNSSESSSSSSSENISGNSNENSSESSSGSNDNSSSITVQSIAEAVMVTSLQVWLSSVLCVYSYLGVAVPTSIPIHNTLNLTSYTLHLTPYTYLNLYSCSDCMPRREKRKRRPTPPKRGMRKRR